MKYYYIRRVIDYRFNYWMQRKGMDIIWNGLIDNATKMVLILAQQELERLKLNYPTERHFIDEIKE